jgi:hypothetical protein
LRQRDRERRRQLKRDNLSLADRIGEHIGPIQGVLFDENADCISSAVSAADRSAESRRDQNGGAG